MSRFPLKSRIAGLIVAAGGISVLVMVILTLWGESKVNQEVKSDLAEFMRKNIAQITTDVYTLCKNTNDLLLERADLALKRISDHLKLSGGFSLGSELRTIEGTESGGEVTPYELPVLIIQGQVWPYHRDKSQPVPMVDDVHQWAGMDCSVYQRLNDQGDMIRIGTSLIAPNGQRAVGIIRPAIGRREGPDPVIASVLAGRVYKKLDYSQNGMMLSGYAPFYDQGGDIIGMIGIKRHFEGLQELSESIMRIRVGQTGYVWVIGGAGPLKGQYIISRKGERDGEMVWNAKDSTGRYFIRQIIQQALKDPAGKVNFAYYSWLNPGESEARRKIAAFTYFQPWGWVIGAGAYEDDYYAAYDRIDEVMGYLLLIVLSGGFLIMLVTMVAAWKMGDRFARPLSKITDLAKVIADGELKTAQMELTAFDTGQTRGGDEAIRLARAFDRMTGSLNELIGQVRQAGIEVKGSATVISAAARQLEVTVAEQAASTTEVTAASREISQRALDLDGAIKEVAAVVAKTADMANTGRNGLDGLETVMNNLVIATSSISSRLANISKKTGAISGVVTTIAKVADQTNLLSLNAAIEAEKAGEAGLGFSIVAREIRRLADQTASSTTDIERIVGQMQSAVSAGIMEMDKFVQQVRSGVDGVGEISGGLSRIIDQVQGLAEYFQTVDEAVSAQRGGVEEISEAMGQLSDSVEETKRALNDFNQAAQQLINAVSGLQDEVARFKVSQT